MFSLVEQLAPRSFLTGVGKQIVFTSSYRRFYRNLADTDGRYYVLNYKI